VNYRSSALIQVNPTISDGGLSYHYSLSERKEKMSSTSADVVRGTLDMLILKVLANEAEHGWGICERIQQRSREALRVQQGSLYASLHRMTREGWIRSYWGVTANNRQARYYEITRAGRQQLRVESDEWTRLANGVALVMSNA
jgi:PadR family transcriptional regulator PadR